MGSASSKQPSREEFDALFSYRLDEAGRMKVEGQATLEQLREESENWQARQKSGQRNLNLCGFRTIPDDDPDWKVVDELRRGFRRPPAAAAGVGDDPEDEDRARLDRAIGCFLGMVVGDAMGAPLEFQPVRYGVVTVRSLGKPGGPPVGNFQLKPGQWTDDASMGLCLADSLLCRGLLDPVDNMLRYLHWWEHGLNNAFGRDKSRCQSVGLGGNIKASMQHFRRHGWPFTKAGDRNTSGVGSLMRLAAVPIFWWNDIPSAELYARWSSLVTHQGEEAAECCRLLAHIVAKALQAADGDKSFFETVGHAPRMQSSGVSPYPLRQRTLALLSNPTAMLCVYAGRACAGCFPSQLGETFHSSEPSVNYLARSQAEPGEDPDRNWNWKAADFRYAPTRSKAMPGYVGSYAMDALAMALHCVYYSDNFADCLIKAVNLCGDADSLGAVVGQIAGALWGASGIPQDWTARVETWDGGSSAVRAYKLFYRRTFPVPACLRQRFDHPEEPGAGVSGWDGDDAAPAMALWAQLAKAPLVVEAAEAQEAGAAPAIHDAAPDDE